ncbi:hypothetical protein V1289_003536 [Bradyrhizobium sp. AZCC 2289]
MISARSVKVAAWTVLKFVTFTLPENMRTLAKDIADMGRKALRKEGEREDGKRTIERGGHLPVRWGNKGGAAPDVFRFSCSRPRWTLSTAQP